MILKERFNSEECQATFTYHGTPGPQHRSSRAGAVVVLARHGGRVGLRVHVHDLALCACTTHAWAKMRDKQDRPTSDNHHTCSHLWAVYVGAADVPVRRRVANEGVDAVLAHPDLAVAPDGKSALSCMKLKNLMDGTKMILYSTPYPTFKKSRFSIKWKKVYT